MKANSTIFVGRSHKKASYFKELLPFVLADERDEVRDALDEARIQSRWIVSSLTDTRMLLKQAVAEIPLTHSMGNVLLLTSTAESLVPMLGYFFKTIIWGDPGKSLLPLDELVAVLKSEKRGDLAISVQGTEYNVLQIGRGDFSHVLVPYSYFKPRNGLTPDFKDITVTDFGQTIRFGEYESSLDAILYAYDPDYRQRAKSMALEEAGGFGASLKRLRLMRGLSRDDFGSSVVPKQYRVSSKTIARIEREEQDSVRPGTMKKLAKTLGVTVEELASAGF